MTRELSLDDIKSRIRNIPDFPEPGIQFKDITTALKQPEIFSAVVDLLAAGYTDKHISRVVCVESRGFILGGAIAAKLGAGFVPIRKPGKLPAETISATYKMEYGTNSIEIHKDAIKKDDILLLHDDLLATGGTVRAAVELLKSFNPRKIYICFFCELDFLKGRETLPDFHIRSLIHF